MSGSEETTSLDLVDVEQQIALGPDQAPKSTRLKVALLAFLAVIVVGMSAMTFYLVSTAFAQLTPTIRADLTARAEAGASELARVLDLSLAVEDAERTRVILESFRGGDVVTIAAVTPAGKIIGLRGELALPLETIFAGEHGKLRETTDHFVSWEPSEIEGSVVGRVGVVVSKARLLAGGKLRARVLLVAGISGVVSLLVGLAFLNFYIGPLVALTERAMIALQNLAATLEERVRRRTNQLSHSKQKLEENLLQLKDTQRKLMEVSRHAGMAEVATSVLHNVGNVLNTVNVAGNIVTEALKRSKVPGLTRVVELIAAHEHDLGDFLTRDAKGKKLPDYLKHLAAELLEERARMLKEMDTLTVNLEHIKVIVTTQQTHAKTTGGLSELVAPTDIVEEAISFNQASYRNHGISVEKDLEALPPMLIDRHKLMQILMNLLSNARHAVGDLDHAVVRVTMRENGDNFSIAVSDNGKGIAPENVKKIFVHGFTTKRDGHGFGLHSSALAASEMGGSLSFFSDGAGKGATFTLELPQRRAESVAPAA